MDVVAKIFADFPSYFNKGTLDDEMTIYFSIGDGKWTVKVGPDSIDVKPGKLVEDADLLLKTSPELFEKMVLKGYTPGTLDFITGKIKSNNPPGLVMLREIFTFPGSKK